MAFGPVQFPKIQNQLFSGAVRNMQQQPQKNPASPASEFSLTQPRVGGPGRPEGNKLNLLG